MPRFISNSLRIALDLLVLSIAYWLAFLFRFEFAAPARPRMRPAGHLAVRVILVQYAGARRVRRAAHVVALRDHARRRSRARRDRGCRRASSSIAAARASPSRSSTSSCIPLGVLAMDFVLAFVGLVGVRARWRCTARSRSAQARGRRRAAPRAADRRRRGRRAGRARDHEPPRPRPASGRLPRRRSAQARHAASAACTCSARRRWSPRSPSASASKRALITIANASGQQIRRITERVPRRRARHQDHPRHLRDRRRQGEPVADPRGRDRGLARPRAGAARRGDRRRHDPQPRRARHRRRRQHRLGAVPAGLPLRPRAPRARRAVRERAVRDPPRARAARSRTCRSSRASRDICDVARMEQIFEASKPGARVPRRRAQARADDGVEPGRGGEEQRRRHAHRRRPRAIASASSAS